MPLAIALDVGLDPSLLEIRRLLSQYVGNHKTEFKENNIHAHEEES
jgi:hypothetical protein